MISSSHDDYMTTRVLFPKNVLLFNQLNTQRKYILPKNNTRIYLKELAEKTNNMGRHKITVFCSLRE